MDLEQRLQDANSEHERLLSRLNQKDFAEEALVQAKQNLEEERQARQSLEAAQQESKQENELMLLQLHQVQEELETLFLQQQQSTRQHAEIPGIRSSSDREMAEKNLQIRQLQNEVAVLRQSWSWRVTTPLRRLTAGVMGGNKAKKEQAESMSG